MFGTFFIAGIFLPGHAVGALFFAAVAPAALLYIGIHNAWDSITYTVLRRAKTIHEGAKK